MPLYELSTSGEKEASSPSFGQMHVGLVMRSVFIHGLFLILKFKAFYRSLTLILMTVYLICIGVHIYIYMFVWDGDSMIRDSLLKNLSWLKSQNPSCLPCAFRGNQSVFSK